MVSAALQRMGERNKKFRKPDDLVFANRLGNALDRHNLLNRRIKKTVAKLGCRRRSERRSDRCANWRVLCIGEGFIQTPTFRKTAARLPARWDRHQKIRIHNDYPCDSEPEHAVPVGSLVANRKS